VRRDRETGEVTAVAGGSTFSDLALSGGCVSLDGDGGVLTADHDGDLPYAWRGGAQLGLDKRRVLRLAAWRLRGDPHRVRLQDHRQGVTTDASKITRRLGRALETLPNVAGGGGEGCGDV